MAIAYDNSRICVVTRILCLESLKRDILLDRAIRSPDFAPGVYGAVRWAIATTDPNMRLQLLGHAAVDGAVGNACR
ncbi:hypothetical protein [Nodosilinea sp. LEGE 06152]|uniref:hypothetical protein n=1 Tax=Nodosilinea sp. LEGE 06152 TaxID=2777966 RepID=UPI00187F82D7|nr:hypothetical protein [Nodosilinea sp. LEGE 06152]